jgi:hypothetical protein
VYDHPSTKPAHALGALSENVTYKNGRIRYLGERLKDWIGQLLKALSSGRGLGEGKLKWLFRFSRDRVISKKSNGYEIF